MNSAKINWGDGTIENIQKGSKYTKATHTYTKGKARTIAINIYEKLSSISFDECLLPSSIDTSKNQTSLMISFDEDCYSSDNYPMNITGGDYLNSLYVNFWTSKQLILNKCDNLRTICLRNLTMSSIDLSEAPNLSSYTNYFTQNTAIDLAKNTKLTSLTIYNFSTLTSLNLNGLTNVNSFNISASNLISISCVNTSSTIYNSLNNNFSNLSSTGTLTTDNSSASATLRATAEAKGWTVVIE